MMGKGFSGFQAPFYTMVPNELLDELMGDLSGAELKVALYVCRRTFGFGKLEDSISLSQLQDGILAKDGRQLDRGCGVRSKTSIVAAVKALVEQNILVAVRRQSNQHGFEPTSYRLNVVGTHSETPLVPKTGTRGASSKIGTSLVSETGTSLVPKTGHTKESKKKSHERKHHHRAESSESVPAPAVRGDDDARETRLTGDASESGLAGLVERMLALGLSPRLVAKYAAEHPVDRIAQVLDRLPHRKAQNPAGYFIAELQSGDFAAPPVVARKERQVSKARALQVQVETDAAAEVSIRSRIEVALGRLDATERAALMEEARRDVARQSHRRLVDVAPDSPWVQGVFEGLVEQRYCQPGVGGLRP